MNLQRKSCRKGCSHSVLSTSGLSSGRSITTVCSPACNQTAQRICERRKRKFVSGSRDQSWES